MVRKYNPERTGQEMTVYADLEYHLFGFQTTGRKEKLALPPNITAFYIL